MTTKAPKPPPNRLSPILCALRLLADAELADSPGIQLGPLQRTLGRNHPAAMGCVTEGLAVAIPGRRIGRGPSPTILRITQEGRQLLAAHRKQA
jgi:hypothetical protein